jgi:hypothetical protein
LDFGLVFATLVGLAIVVAIVAGGYAARLLLHAGERVHVDGEKRRRR